MLIAAVVPNPWVALPLAFASHFICDALPHLGTKFSLKSKGFSTILLIDMGLAALLLLVITAAQPEHWLVITSAGIAAASPDLAWLPDYMHAVSKWPRLRHGWLARFHGWIQWSETPWGLLVEVPWLAAILLLLVRLA
jgi:hypothetical protein